MYGYGDTTPPADTQTAVQFQAQVLEDQIRNGYISEATGALLQLDPATKSAVCAQMASDTKGDAPMAGTVASVCSNAGVAPGMSTTTMLVAGVAVAGLAYLIFS